MNPIGHRIKEILEAMPGAERGKQTRLSDLAGCTRALIGQLMKNPAQTLGYEYARNIEDRLGYSADWLLSGKLPKMAKDRKRQPANSTELDEAVELMLLYRQSTDAARIRVMEYARQADKVPATLRSILTIDKS